MIQNVRCIAYCINLIACDIVEHKFADKLLCHMNILAAFFHNNSRAGKTNLLFLFFCLTYKTIFNFLDSKFQELIKVSGISGGGIKCYCKMRWTTSSESVNSIIRLKQVLLDISKMKLTFFKFYFNYLFV